MTASAPQPSTMRAVRFHGYGEPADVLRLDQTAVPAPGPGQVLAAVEVCGLNPADWALCRGLFAGLLPRGVGLEIAGTVEAVGAGVTDVSVGDRIIGVPNYADGTSAGLADYAILNFWTPLPAGLDPAAGASLPMVVETAFRSLNSLAVSQGQTVVIHGAGTMVGFAAVQIALMGGARVIATAGESFAEQLRGFGAMVTPYGDGMVERVRDLAGGSPDVVLDTSPPGRGVLPDLVTIAGGDARRVLTITDMEAAKHLGVRSSMEEGGALRYDALPRFAALAAEGRFDIPIARTFPLDDWRLAMEASQTGHAHGKLLVAIR